MKKYVLFSILVGLMILVVYEALIFYDNNFKYGRMWETVAIRPHEQPILQSQERVVPFHGGDAVFRVTAAEALNSPIGGASSETIQLGKILYFTYCAQCHGKNYDGNGTVGQSFSPLPTDLRSVKVQFLAEGAFFKEISYGIPNGRQPPLATTIDPLDRWRIMAYIKSLGVRK